MAAKAKNQYTADIIAGQDQDVSVRCVGLRPVASGVLNTALIGKYGHLGGVHVVVDNAVVNLDLRQGPATLRRPVRIVLFLKT